MLSKLKRREPSCDEIVLSATFVDGLGVISYFFWNEFWGLRADTGFVDLYFTRERKCWLVAHNGEPVEFTVLQDTVGVAPADRAPGVRDQASSRRGGGTTNRLVAVGFDGRKLSASTFGAPGLSCGLFFVVAKSGSQLPSRRLLVAE